MDYLNSERKKTADVLRKGGNEDVLAMRKSIGRKGKSSHEKALGNVLKGKNIENKERK
jgi:hypothetical protein